MQVRPNICTEYLNWMAHKLKIIPISTGLKPNDALHQRPTKQNPRLYVLADQRPRFRLLDAQHKNLENKKPTPSLLIEYMKDSIFEIITYNGAPTT